MPAADTGWDDLAWGPAEADADTLDRVVEVANLMASFAAERLVRVDTMRRNALADAGRFGTAAPEIVERSVRLELAAALRVTESAAGVLMAQGEALVHRYPTVLQSLSQARITERHSDILIESVDAIEPELRETVLPRALQLAESQPVGAFRRSLRKLIDTARYATLAERHEEALKARRVIVEPAGDGMAWLGLFGPAVEVHAIFGRATAIARVLARQDGETRTLDQLRADVMGDLLIEGDTVVHPPQARGIHATVTVTVPVLSLLDGAPTGTGDPATVQGVGPIPLGRARELCGGSEGWMRVLTHPVTGMVVSAGREQYRPPPALRRLVRWRADRCMAPGCGVPASRCEIDHTIAWEYGGETSLDNLGPLCTGHHTVKHHGGWQVRQIDGSGGAMEWTSPAGRRYVVEPERAVPVFHPTPEDHAAA